MSYRATAPATDTYTTLDVETVVRRFTADIVMIAQSSGAITEEKAREYAHDVEALAKRGYIKQVDLTLFSGAVERRSEPFKAQRLGRTRLRQQRVRHATQGLRRVNQHQPAIRLFDSETVLPDAALSAKEKTLLGFETRYQRVHKQLGLLFKLGEISPWNKKHYNGKLTLCDLVAEQYPLAIFHGDVGTGKTAT